MSLLACAMKFYLKTSVWCHVFEDEFLFWNALRVTLFEENCLSSYLRWQDLPANHKNYPSTPLPSLASTTTGIDKLFFLSSFKTCSSFYCFLFQSFNCYWKHAAIFCFNYHLLASMARKWEMFLDLQTLSTSPSLLHSNSDNKAKSATINNKSEWQNGSCKSDIESTKKEQREGITWKETFTDRQTEISGARAA